MHHLDHALTAPLLTNQDGEKSAAGNASWEPSLSRPTLLIIFSKSPKPKDKNANVWTFLNQACIATFKECGLKTKYFETKETWSLKGRHVVALGADFKTLLRQAEIKSMPKRYDWGGGVHWTPFTLEDTEEGSRSSFVGLNDPDAESNFFTESETLTLLRSLAYSGSLPVLHKQRLVADAGEDIHALGTLCEHHSTLKIAEHAGVVETIMCLHTHYGEELRSQFTEAAFRGPLMGVDGIDKFEKGVKHKKGRPYHMNLHGFAAYLGGGLSDYFLFMRTYCTWLLVPAVVGILSITLHALPIIGDEFSNRHNIWYGIVMTVWTTLFVEKFKRAKMEFGYRSGHSCYDYVKYMTSPIEFILSEEDMNALKTRKIEPAQKIELKLLDNQQTIGMKYGFDGLNLKITEIMEEGAIDSWNKANPEENNIREGDYVYAINGARGSLDKLVAELDEIITKKSRSISSLTFHQQSRSKRPKNDVTKYLISIIATFIVFGVTGAVIMFFSALMALPYFLEGNIIWQNVPIGIYIVVVAVLEPCYSMICEWLTQMEGHLLYSEYIKSLCIKSALFQLVNWYGYFWFIAFWQQDLENLRMQLLIFMTGQQVSNKLMDTGIAYLKSTFQKVKTHKHPPKTDEAKFLLALEEQYIQEPADLSFEYCEMATVFGAVTMFATVFPLGGILALLQCWWEMYNDSYQKFKLGRRPLPRPGYNDVVTDTWLSIFEMLSVLTVVLNTALLVIAWPGHLSFLAWILIEHGLLAFKAYLSWSIPDRPEWVVREELEVEQAINVRKSNQALLKKHRNQFNWTQHEALLHGEL